MIEKPILFSGPMVRAILVGKKTQTRRAIRYPQRGAFVIEDHGRGWEVFQSDNGESSLCNDGNEYPMNCPYGQPGDHLWVRETWGWVGEHHHEDHGSIYWKSDRADWVKSQKWRPSIFMPHWASRIVLYVTDVKVEKLQSMSYTDWVADFCPSSAERESALATFVGDGYRREREKELWDSINSKRGFGWDKNPWVWVVGFKRVV